MARAGGVRSVAEQAATTGSPRRARVWARARRSGHVGIASADHVGALDPVAQIAYVRGGSAGRECGDVGKALEGHGGTVAGVAATSGRWQLQQRRRRRRGRARCGRTAELRTSVSSRPRLRRRVLAAVIRGDEWAHGRRAVVLMHAWLLAAQLDLVDRGDIPVSS